MEKDVKRAAPGYGGGINTARKGPFAGGFIGKAGEVPVEILDREHAETIRARYPNVWWVKKDAKM